MLCFYTDTELENLIAGKKSETISSVPRYMTPKQKVSSVQSIHGNWLDGKIVALGAARETWSEAEQVMESLIVIDDWQSSQLDKWGTVPYLNDMAVKLKRESSNMPSSTVVWAWIAMSQVFVNHELAFAVAETVDAALKKMWDKPVSPKSELTKCDYPHVKDNSKCAQHTIEDIVGFEGFEYPGSQ